MDTSDTVEQLEGSPASVDGSEDMDQPDCDRNPSPPPEFVEHPELLLAESIGNTAFSKHWLFTTLIKLIEEVDRENEAESDLAVDVDEELQTELCKLWDMSMNSDVARFLEEFQAVEIMSGIIEKSKAPRVIEICVGILGNMACEPNVCQKMSENHKFIDLVLDMMETRDGRTLVENTRLIAACLANTGARGPWIRAIKRSEEVLNHLKFIFSSSTNCDLLKNTAELVDTLLNLEPDLCVSWATIYFIESLLEATEQIGSNHSEAMEVYLHIFQSFSTTEPGVEALVAHVDRLERKIIKYLNIVCEYEIVGLDGKYGPLSSALSVLNILLTSRPVEKLTHLCKDETIIRILLKILEPLYPMLMKYRQSLKASSDKPVNEQKSDHVTSSGQPELGGGENIKNEPKDNKVDEGAENEDKTELNEEEREELQQLEVLYEVLSGYLLDYCNIAVVYPTKSSSSCDTLVLEKSASETQTGEYNVTQPVDQEVSSANTEYEGESEKSTSLENLTEKNVSDKNTDSDAVSLTIKETDLHSDKLVAESSVQESFEEKNTETSVENKHSSGDTSQSDDVPILTYLDEACSRWRINNFGLTLKDSNVGNKIFSRLVLLAKDHGKERLTRILIDIEEGKIVTRADSSKDTAAEIDS